MVTAGNRAALGAFGLLRGQGVRRREKRRTARIVYANSGTSLTSNCPDRKA